MTTKIGVLGGSFNPPHVGHLLLAQEALEQLELDRVLLMVANTPPHKVLENDPGAEERFALSELATSGDERLEASRVEVDRGGSSFSVETLGELHATHPEAELTFIVGADMACSFPSWREPEAILDLARLGVVERDGLSKQDVLNALSALPNANDRVQFFSMPRVEISSSLVRNYASSGRSIRYLVRDEVADHIAKQGLYGATNQPRGIVRER